MDSNNEEKPIENFNLKEYKKSYNKKNEKGLIELGLTEIDDLYSPYSLINNKKIDPNIDNHICDIENYVPLGKDLVLDIYVEKKYSTTEKTEAINTYRKYYSDYLFEINAELKRYSLLAIVLFCIGLSCVLIYYLSLTNNWWFMIQETLEIVSWVFIWETVDIIFFHGFKLLIKKRRAKRLINAEISFKSYDNENKAIKLINNIKTDLNNKKRLSDIKYKK